MRDPACGPVPAWLSLFSWSGSGEAGNEKQSNMVEYRSFEKIYGLFRYQRYNEYTIYVISWLSTITFLV